MSGRRRRPSLQPKLNQASKLIDKTIKIHFFSRSRSQLFYAKEVSQTLVCRPDFILHWLAKEKPVSMWGNIGALGLKHSPTILEKLENKQTSQWVRFKSKWTRSIFKRRGRCDIQSNAQKFSISVRRSEAWVRDITTWESNEVWAQDHFRVFLVICWVRGMLTRLACHTSPDDTSCWGYRYSV